MLIGLNGSRCSAAVLSCVSLLMEFLLIGEFILRTAGEPQGVSASPQDTPFTAAKSTEVSPTSGSAPGAGGRSRALAGSAALAQKGRIVDVRGPDSAGRRHGKRDEAPGKPSTSPKQHWFATVEGGRGGGDISRVPSNRESST